MNFPSHLSAGVGGTLRVTGDEAHRIPPPGPTCRRSSSVHGFSPCLARSPDPMWQILASHRTFSWWLPSVTILLTIKYWFSDQYGSAITVGFQNTLDSGLSEPGGICEMFWTMSGKRTWLVYLLALIGHLKRLSRFGSSSGCHGLEVPVSPLTAFSFLW